MSAGRVIKGAAALAAIVVAALLSLPAVSPAATFDVNTPLDEDTSAGTNCSLREAITAANTDGDHNDCLGDGTGVDDGPDTIELDNGVDYLRSIMDSGADEDTNATGDLDIIDAGGGQEEDLTITAPGPAGANISGNLLENGGRVIHVVSADAILTISRVEIEQGRTLNPGPGAGIFSFGTLNISDSLVTNNVSEEDGGGIENAGGTVNATNVTITENSAWRHGGGLANVLGTSNLYNVTISDNEADNNGDATVGLGGGITNPLGTVSLRNTIVAGNTQHFTTPNTAPDCSGTIAVVANNLIGNPTGCTPTGGTGNLIGVSNPGLAFSPAENGGPTRTVALLAGSPARDTGNPATPGTGGNSCLGADQRGVARPLGAFCDIGAFEATPIPPAAGTPAAGTPTTTGTTTKKKCRKKKRKRSASAAKKKCKKKKRK
jgi:CSLREA domain-containing protein